jgi:hypothetical protein
MEMIIVHRPFNMLSRRAGHQGQVLQDIKDSLLVSDENICSIPPNLCLHISAVLRTHITTMTAVAKKKRKRLEKEQSERREELWEREG